MQVKQCNKCGVEKPLTEFHRNGRHKDGLSYTCKVCARERSRQWHRDNPEHELETARRYHAANPGKRAAFSRAWRAANPDKVQAQRQKSIPYQRLWGKQRYDQLRAAVLDHYGRSCACCGTADNLSIDHIDGTGRQHRAELRIKTGDKTYAWLVKNNFPDGFQILCVACNASKGIGPSCNLNHNTSGGARWHS